jgi:hypothetical protein
MFLCRYCLLLGIDSIRVDTDHLVDKRINLINLIKTWLDRSRTVLIIIWTSRICLRLRRISYLLKRKGRLFHLIKGHWVNLKEKCVRLWQGGKRKDRRCLKKETDCLGYLSWNRIKKIKKTNRIIKKKRKKRKRWMVRSEL